MIRLHLSAELLNQILARFPEYRLVYQSGCFTGYFKLPIGGANVVAIPAGQPRAVVLSIPFQQIRGDLTKGFLLSKLAKMAWGSISNMIETQARSALMQAGMPPDTVTVGRQKSQHGDVGVVTISYDAINQWLARQNTRGALIRLHSVFFSPAGVNVELEVSRRAPSAIPRPPSY